MIKLIYNRFAEQELKFKVVAEGEAKGFSNATKELRLFGDEAKSLSALKPNFDFTEMIKGLSSAKKQLDDLKKAFSSTKLYGKLDASRLSGLETSIFKSQSVDLSSYSSPGTMDFSNLKLDTSKLSKKDIQALKEYITNLQRIKELMDDIAKEHGFKIIGDEAETSKDKIKDVANELNKIPKGLDGLTKAFKNLDFSKLVYLAHTVKRVTSVLVDMVESAADYEESLNLYRMALGKYADEATKWEELISEKLMLDPADVMKYTGAFYNLVKGLGATSDASFLMSKNLTQLTYDMASYLNISNDAAQAKIQSAMAGQSRAVATVGVATQLASLQELAYSLNIKKKVSEMTQSEKTYLRYIQLMRSTTQMQGDLGRTMITPANAIRTLKNQIELLARAIGQVLTPIIMKVIPYIMAFTNVLRKAAQSLAGLLGYKLSDVDWDSTFSFEGADEVADKLDSVGGAAKKAGDSVRNSLAPFDELNQVMFESSGAGGGSGGGSSVSLSGDDFSALLPSYDMLKDYTGELAEKAKGLEDVVSKLALALGGFVVVKKVVGWLSDLKSIFEGTNKTMVELFGADKAAMIGGVIKTIASWAGIILGTISTLKNTYKVIEDIFYTTTKLGTGWTDAANLAVNGAALIQGALVAVLTAFNPILGGLVFFGTVLLDTAAAVNGYERAWQEIIDNDIYGTLSVSTEQWTSLLQSEGGTLSKTTDKIKAYDGDLKSLKDSFAEANNNVGLFEMKFRATGKATKEESDAMIKSVKTMTESSKSYIDTNTDKMLTLWRDRFSGMSDYSDEEQKEIINGIMKYGSDQKTELDNAQNNISKTYENAIKKRGYLTDDEYEYIEEQLAKIRELTETNMSESATNLEYLHQQYTDKATELDKNSYATWKEASKQYREDEMKNLDTWYNQQYNALVSSKKQLRWSEEKFHDEVVKLGEDRKKKEKGITDTINKYQDDILKNLAEKYKEAGETQTEENARIQESIAKIFADSEVDETHLKEIFKQAGIDADDSFVENFKQQSKGELSKNGWQMVGEAAVDGVKGSFTQNTPQRVKDMLSTLSGILQTDSKQMSFGQKIQAIGNTIGGFVLEGFVREKTGVAGNILMSLANGLSEKMRAGVSGMKTALDNVGKLIWDGISSGLTNAKNLANSASKLAKDLVKAIKNALGIKSPSRLFIDERVGDYITMGIEEGMLSEISYGIPKVADSLLTTMQDTLDESNDITFGDKLSTGIEEITDGFKDMNDEILEFNKNANNIAINSNITTNRKLTSDYNDIMGLVSGTYATDGNNASNLVDTVREASNTNNTIIVQIGDETVYQGQGQYQSRESDRYGTSYVKI